MSENKLPDVKNFSIHKTVLKDMSYVSSKIVSTSNIDLDNYHKNLIDAKLVQQQKSLDNQNETNPTHLLYELFSQKLLRSFNYPIKDILNKYIGYSKKHKSITISVFDNEDSVKSIAIKKANEIRWKSYGSKSFISSKIKEDIMFLAVGMKELVLFELMNISYIHLQADSMYKHINQKIVARCMNKNIFILKENDESFNKLIRNLQTIFIHANIFIIDFEKLLKKKLSKGYDFVDYCNEVGDINQVEKQIESEIMLQIKGDLK